MIFAHVKSVMYSSQQTVSFLRYLMQSSFRKHFLEVLIYEKVYLANVQPEPRVQSLNCFEMPLCSYSVCDVLFLGILD